MAEQKKIELNKNYVRKVIGEGNSVYEIAEKAYIIARRKKAFEEYWDEQLHSLPEQIVTLFKDLVTKGRFLKKLDGKLAEYRNIFDVINLLQHLLNILPPESKEPKKNSNKGLDEFSYDEDWFIEDEEEMDIFWDDVPIITHSDFIRLLKFDASNIFENKLYLSKRWNKLSEEILSIFKKEFEEVKGYKNLADKKMNIANSLQKIISKKSKETFLEKSNMQDNLIYFIAQYKIVYEELSNHALQETYLGENLAIEIKQQTPKANRVMDLKSEIFKVKAEIEEISTKKIPEKINLHIRFLKTHYLVSVSEEESDHSRHLSYKKSHSSLFSLQLEEGIEESRKKAGPESPKAITSHDITENEFMHLVKNTYIQFFTSQLYDNDRAPDEVLIDIIGSVADYLSDDDNASTEQKEHVEINKEELYPIQHISESLPIQYHPIGLTHSGGGRRAEIFNLGIQQELAKLGALPWFDYLTTVSGGGWAGVNMVSLLSRKSSKTHEYFFNTQWSKYPFNPGRKIFKIPDSEPTKAQPKEGWLEDYVADEVGQNAQLKYLRDNGNYLAPRQGWINRDALRVLGWIVSSLMMNIFMFLVILLMVSSSHYLLNFAFAPEIGNTYYIFENDTPGEDGCPITRIIPEDDPIANKCIQSEKVSEAIFDWNDKWPIYATFASISFLLSLLGVMIINLSYKKFDKKQSEIDPAKWKARYNFWFFVLLLAPLIIILNPQTRQIELTEWIFVLFLALLFVFFWGRRKYWKTPAGGGRSSEEDIDAFLLENLAFFSLTFPIFMVAFTKWILHASELLTSDSLQIYWVLMPLVISFGAGLGMWAYVIVHSKKPFGESRFRTIFWAYLGYHNIYLIVIAVFTGISVSLFFSQINEEGPRLIIPVSTALLSAISTGIMVYTKDKGKMKSLTSGFVLISKISAGLRNYVLGLLVILLNISIIYIFESLLDQYIFKQSANRHLIVLAFAFGSFLLFIFLSRFVNFNDMSLHYFWRDRTEEAFLKTDLVGKHGEVITVRDDRNLLLGSEINDLNCSAPYHLITTAINLQGSWRFDVKDRKSQHFIFSRDYTGSEITGYVKTSDFRVGKMINESGDEVYNGLTKYSKAMAISAAAFASALGNESFFAEGFAMTLFNIRLGWWLLNPKLYDDDPDFEIIKKFPVTKKAFNIKKELIDKNKFLSKLENKSGWTSGWAPYIFDEALSLANERRELINVSDGGHTGDNPGVYPLLQRRCKVIVVGDASYDPAAQCEQFMNALLYAKNDLRIDVDIDLTGLYPATEDNDDQKEGMSKNHCAVGEITYPAFEKFPEEKGWIIYLKTSITPEDPSQLLQFWMGHKEMFPQPSTMDQFFEEDQYEAQRLLGEVSVRQPLEKLEKYYEGQLKKIKDTKERSNTTVKLSLVQHVLKRDPDFVGLKKNFNEMMADLQKALLQ